MGAASRWHRPGQLLAGAAAAALTTQPLAVQQLGAGQLRARLTWCDSSARLYDCDRSLVVAAGTRRTVGPGPAAPAAVPAPPAGRRHRAAAGPPGAHRDHVRAGQRVRLAGPAAVVRGAVQTAHRRFSQWTRAGVWPKIHRAVLDELGSQGLIDWSRAIADAACVRAKKGRPDRPPARWTGASPARRSTCWPTGPAPAARRAVGGQRQRCLRAAAPGPGHPGDPLPPRAAPPQARQAARGQGLRPGGPARLGPPPRHRPSDRPQGDRDQRQAGQAPVGY
jgi:hypothetical protein